MKRYLLVVSMVCLLLMLGGCKEKSKEFVLGDNELIHLTSTPRGGVETYEIYTMNIMIYVDGRVRIYASDFVKWLGYDEVPELSFYISEEELDEIQKLIVEQDLYNLREDVGNKDGISGTVKHMTIYSANGTNTTGGISVSNRQFVRAYDRIEAIVREELYLYSSEIAEKQYEGFVIYSNRSVKLLDRAGTVIIDHQNINSVYTEQQELDEGYAYYTVIEFNQYGQEILHDISFGATKEEVEVLTLHLNDTYETSITINGEIGDGKLCIPQATKEDAEALAEKINNSL